MSRAPKDGPRGPVGWFRRARLLDAAAPRAGEGESDRRERAIVGARKALLALACVLPVAHALLGHEQHPFVVRLLMAVPGVLLLLETRAYLRASQGELPFLAFGLIQYYVAFGFPVFFGFEFYDLNGRGHFRSESRYAAALAIALGAVCIVLAAAAGRRMGGARALLKLVPPERLPSRWGDVFFGLAFMTMPFAFVGTMYPGLIPGIVAMPVGLVLSTEFLLGLAIACPPPVRGFVSRNIALLVVLFGGAAGVFRGMLEPMFRMALPYIGANWAFLRRASLGVGAALFALYFAFQPVKGTFRQQVWGSAVRTGTEVGYTARVDAWSNSFASVWGDERVDTEEIGRSSIARLCESDSVIQAFDVLPGRVQFLDGQGLLTVFYAFIPRFIWPDKPTTKDTVQRYAVTFGRQTERGAETTAINLPLLVEGYWNLGWPGIVLVTSIGGLWLGIAQRMFAMKHWALRALGVVQFTRVGMTAPCVFLVGGMFQSMLVFGLATWVLWGVASVLSGRDARALVGGRRPRPFAPRGAA